MEFSSDGLTLVSVVREDLNEEGSFNIPPRVNKIGLCAFQGLDELKHIVIPNNVLNIGECAFRGCDKLSKVYFSHKLKGIGNWAFQGCSSLKSMVISDGVEKIGEGAFSRCKNMTSITLPRNLTRVSESLFADCSSLTNLTIPHKVRSIGTHAFNFCLNLEKITFDSVNLMVDRWAFGYCDNLKYIVVDDNKQNEMCALLPKRLSPLVRANSIYERSIRLVENSILNIINTPELSPLYQARNELFLPVQDDILGEINSFLSSPDKPLGVLLKSATREIKSMCLPFHERELNEFREMLITISKRYKEKAIDLTNNNKDIREFKWDRFGVFFPHFTRFHAQDPSVRASVTLSSGV